MEFCYVLLTCMELFSLVSVVTAWFVCFPLLVCKMALLSQRGASVSSSGGWVRDKLNKLPQTADKGWPPSLGVEREAKNSRPPTVRHQWNLGNGLSNMPGQREVLQNL